MSTPTGGTFDVFDMASQYAADNNIDPTEIFTKPEEKPAEVPAPAAPEGEAQDKTPTPSQPVKKAKKPWTPDEALIADMPDLHHKPVTYAKDEYREESDDKALENIADDKAIQDSREAMDSLQRTAANLEDAKKRKNIKHLQIPPGQYHAMLTAAAGDNNYQRAKEKLDKLLDEIITTYPEFILEWIDPSKAPDAEKADTGKVINLPTAEQTTASGDEVTDFPDPSESDSSEVTEGAEAIEGDVAKVVIDKTNLPDVSWTEEEAAKIRKARTIELNIRESKPINFSEISGVPDNMVDAVLSQYQRKTNDVVASLPASKYRCCFRGLSYPEVLDLTNSIELNNLDGERKKWSICFEHIYNQSIGPWEEYILYKDPETFMEVRCEVGDTIPEEVDKDTIHPVSKFEDFMRKTSYLDLEFMLWKILCATALDKEVIGIDCKAVHNGKPCGRTYDWVYSPSELIVMDSISPAVLEEMKETAEAESLEESLRIYHTSPVAANNTVTLPTSGWSLVYGHASGYEYVEHIYTMVKELQGMLRDNKAKDPTLPTRTMAAATLTSIKAVLVPGPHGGHSYIVGPENIMKAINKMDEVDWQLTSKLVEMMIQPYELRFELKDIVCPQCKNRSSIEITNMLDLLFIVAQSLSNVQVELKTT